MQKDVIFYCNFFTWIIRKHVVKKPTHNDKQDSINGKSTHI